MDQGVLFGLESPESSMKADVAIIGAGPAGGGAALRLASTGLRILFFEKAVLPRPKPCGGALAPGIDQILGMDTTPLIERKIHHVCHLLNFRNQKLRWRKSPPFFWMINRSRFDHRLVERALEVGGSNIELRDGFRIKQIEENTRAVTLRAQRGEIITATYAIVANGAGRGIVQTSGLSTQAHFGAGIDAEVIVVPEVFEKEKSRATFNHFCIPHGYGWIFPKNEILSCGVMSWLGNRRLGGCLDDFLEKSFPSGSILSVRRAAHRIPRFSGRRQIASRRVCLVGDAAHLVDPIMGEGLGRALKSGVLAADSIALLLGANTGENADCPDFMRSIRSCRLYQHRVEQEIIADLEAIYRLILPVYVNAPEAFYRQFVLEGRNYRRVARELSNHLSEPQRRMRDLP
jgi:geranylgeranyl reductase family protein